MSIYTVTRRLRSEDVNIFQKLRTSRLMEMLQEISIAHTEELGAGRDKTLDHGFLWVILQQEVKIYHLPQYDDEITLISWPGKTMHVLFPRYYQIKDKEGKLLIDGSALWTLIDQETRKMIFPDQNGIFVEGEETGEEYPLPKRIQSQETDRETVFHVPFSYCDLNGHMNNTRYFDLFDDTIKREDPSPAFIQAEYSHEARYKTDIILHSHTKDNTSYLEGSTDDQTCFKISITHPS